MDEWTTCPDCGFGCLKSQLGKTKGKCPRCYKDEADKHIKRVAYFKAGGIVANIPAEVK